MSRADRTLFAALRPYLLAFLVGLSFAYPSAAQVASDESDSFELAQKLFEDASYANAAEEYRRFIVNYPSSDRIPAASYRLGESFFMGGAYDDARVAFRDFADRFPKHLDVARALRLAAESLERAGQHEEAGRAFREVHDAFMGGEYAPQDLLRAGYNYHRAGVLDAAENAFRSLIERYPEPPLRDEATYNLGTILNEDGRPEEARAQFTQLAETADATERRPDALLSLAEIELAAGKRADAQALVTRLRTEHPRTPAAQTSYLTLAEWFEKRGERGLAVGEYEAALKALPKGERRQRAELGLADAYRVSGDHPRALAAYAGFLKGTPESDLVPRARLGLGMAYAGLRDYRTAVQAFQRLVESHPQSASAIQAYLEIGTIWRDLGDLRKALSAFETFEERTLEPEAKARARLSIGALYERLEWYDKALATYQSLAAEDTPLAGAAQFRLAQTLEAADEAMPALREYQVYLSQYASGPHAEEAERHILFLQEFRPSTSAGVLELIAGLPALTGDPDTRLHMARKLRGLGRDDAAAQALVGFNPADSTRAPEAFYLLGQSYTRLSRTSELTGDPSAADTFRQLARDAYTAVAGYPDNGWSDDAALALIDAQFAGVPSDASVARAALLAYEAFQASGASSDLHSAADLGAADALMVLGVTEPDLARKALETYVSVSRQHPSAPLGERAAFGKGLAQAQLKQFADAEETFRSFLFEYPGSRLSDRAGFELGRILVDRGFYASAAEELAPLLKAPTSLELERKSRLLLAECYFRNSDYVSAIELDTRSLARQPGPEVFRRLAQSYRKTHAPDDAVRIYADYVRTFPESADGDSIAMERGRMLAQMGRTSEARSAFEDFLAAFPRSGRTAEALGMLGDLYYDGDDCQNALKAYGRIGDEGRTESVSGRMALCLFRLGREKEGEKAVETFARKHGASAPWLARFDVERGRLNLRAGNSDRARKRFQEVVQKYPDTEAVADARYFLIRSLEKQGKAEEYFAALMSFVSNHPDSPYWAKASLELAGVYDGEEEYGQAAKIYGRVLEKGLRQEERPAVYDRLIRDYRNLKLYDTAVAFAARLVEEYPRHPLAHAARISTGFMLHDKGDHAGAIRELTPLLKSTDGDDWSTVQHTIAESYFDMGDIDSALREFLKLRYNSQGSVNWLASALIGLSDCYDARGQLAKAVEELEEIRRRFGATSPFSTHAEAKIRRLEERLSEGRNPSPGIR